MISMNNDKNLITFPSLAVKNKTGLNPKNVQRGIKEHTLQTWRKHNDETKQMNTKTSSMHDNIDPSKEWKLLRWSRKYAGTFWKKNCFNFFVPKLKGKCRVRIIQLNTKLYI